MNFFRKLQIIVPGLLILLILVGIFLWKFNLFGSVNGGEEFALKIGNTATVKGKQISLKLLDYRCSSGCPAGEECFWQGFGGCGADLELIVDKKTYKFNLGEGNSFSFPYLSKDYNYIVHFKSVNEAENNYVFIIGEIESVCERKDINQDGCWHYTAISLIDLNYCKKITKQETKDYCFDGVARSSDEPILCDNIKDRNLRNQCLVFFAIKKNSALLCDKVIENENLKDKCLRDLAIKTNNVLLCDRMKDPSIDNYNCLTTLAEHLKDTSLCDKIKNADDRNICYAGVAIESNNIKLCEKVSGLNKDRCLLWFTECDKIIDPGSKDECWIKLAKKNNDIMSCFKITHEESIDICLRSMASSQVACEKITNESYRNKCLDVIK